jgi:hypothetical protein
MHPPWGFTLCIYTFHSAHLCGLGSILFPIIAFANHPTKELILGFASMVKENVCEL